MSADQMQRLLVDQEKVINEGKRWLPSDPDAFVRLRLVRRGAHPDSSYEADVLEA